MSTAGPGQELARGLLTCPRCLLPAMVRTDTLTNDLPAAEGAVVREQVYWCRTPGCDESIHLTTTSDGHFGKKTLRPRQ